MVIPILAEINSKFNLNRSNRVAKLLNDVAASVRKINKTANFIALNVYTQIASRFVRCLSSSYRISCRDWVLSIPDNSLSGEEDNFTSCSSCSLITPLPPPTSWQSAQILLGIVKFCLLKAWNEIDSNFVFISFPAWGCVCVCMCVRVCVCVSVVITIVTTLATSSLRVVCQNFVQEITLICPKLTLSKNYGIRKRFTDFA